MQRFLDFARALGWRYAMAPGHLVHFERYLLRRGVTHLSEVGSAMLLDYQHELLRGRGTATVNGHATSLRALWRYLLREGVVREDAARALPYLRPDHFVPYLYRAQDLARIERALLAAIAETRTSARRFCCRCRHAAFVLLRDCGLRVSEACALDVADYDPKARTLRVALTKFFKTRVIPLPRPTCAALDRYLVHRAHRLAAAPALLLSIAGTRLTRSSLEQPFRDRLRELRLYQPRRREVRTVLGSTNLHALRHSFAVRTLERWQGEGGDVDALLPLLSGYMGHAKVSYTTLYLHLTPALRELASARFGASVLPRLDGHVQGTNDDEA
jgi:site-specific recombinase XerD